MTTLKTLATLACIAALLPHDPALAAGEASRTSLQGARAMQIESAYPVVVTPRLAASRDFYLRHLGFEVVFEASWFVYLASGTTGIAFMTPDHPSQPPGPEAFGGKGVFMTFQVADASKAFQQVKKGGATIAYALRDEPWGQKRFGLVDPNGMWVDVVQQIEPAKGYWDKYMAR